MAHRDVELPKCVEFGITGGPNYSTDIGRNLGGYEARNKNWSNPLRDYFISFPARTKAKHEELLDFMEVIAEGKANSWLVPDPFDFEATAAQGILTDADSNSPTTLYQLYKRRVVGAYSKTRLIEKPRNNGTFTLYDNGALKTTGFSVNYATGIVTITTGSGPFTWSGQFCTPVRFDTDPMKAVIVNKRGDGQFIMSWPSIPLIEVRPD